MLNLLARLARQMIFRIYERLHYCIQRALLRNQNAPLALCIFTCKLAVYMHFAVLSKIKFYF